jgi:tetratricopeptide (TPR) repeat protein
MTRRAAAAQGAKLREVDAMRRLTVFWGSLLWLLAATGISGAAVPLYSGLGTLRHAVTTRSPSAQRYFDQGLKLCYAFNHDEAIRAFREAARLDPACAMAHWGIAYALGPNINLPVDPDREREAFAEVQKARALGSKATPRERAWIDALAKRYSDDPKADLKALDVAFADAMRALSVKYPDDLDAATIYAEALLDVRPWDWWTLDGKPQPGTQDAIAAVTRVLRKNPSHTGANHYLIHAVEQSPAPGRALLAANRLAKLAPNAGHLVHMPSHIYMRLGRYHDATELNRRAIAVDRAYIEAEKPQGIYPMMYYVHNMHMAWAAMSFEGRSKEGIRMARTAADHVPVDMVRKMPPMEFWLPVPYFALARFGKWDEILREPAPPPDLRYTTGMWRYARGVALAATGKADEAAAERDSVAAIAAATPRDAMAGLNSSAALLKLASDVLNGECAMRAGRFEEAAQSFRAAVAQEDSLRYDEPPPWYYPVRQSLGLALLKARKPEEAEAVYREDLKRYPANGWSLYGLTEALNARGRVTEAVAAKKRFTRAWVRADFKLAASAL